MNKCIGIGKILGHSFEARFDADGADLAKVLTGSGDVELTNRAIDTLRRKAYVRDICTRCGAVVERSNA